MTENLSNFFVLGQMIVATRGRECEIAFKDRAHLTRFSNQCNSCNFLHAFQVYKRALGARDSALVAVGNGFLAFQRRRLFERRLSDADSLFFDGQLQGASLLQGVEEKVTAVDKKVQFIIDCF